MIDKVNHEKCTGCKMCADICPTKAIAYVVDDHGFWYPEVNTEKCTKCGLCEKRCPVLHFEPLQNREMPIVYSAWSNNDLIRLDSTSGGLFWEIAEPFLSDGGVVVGCRYREDYKSAEHIVAHTVEELEQLRGSKYFQSDTEGIYKQVKHELQEGKNVLFCGTPCQNAAVRAYLGKEPENLYLMDFICRSINSPKAFAAYVSEWENKTGSKAINVHLKDKTYGWKSLATHIRFADGTETIRDRQHDEWVKGFIYNDCYTRESCYSCQYRTLPRGTADITIGDFWGIEYQSADDMFKGISVVMVNTPKGKQLFDKIKGKTTFQTHLLSEVLPGNPALLKSPEKPKASDDFFKLLKKYPFSVCVHKCMNKKRGRSVSRKIKGMASKMKKAVNLIMDGRISLTKFIYYNYFCKQIIRTGNSMVVPYKGTVLDLHAGSKIYLSGKNLIIGNNLLRGSKAETHVRLEKNAVWKCKNGGLLFYGTVLELKEGALLETGYFSANSGSVIIADKSITFGEDVMLGRNILIYDSDFHSLIDEKGMSYNTPKPVVIGDHVWLTSNITVLKGVSIGAGSLVAAQTVITKDVPPHCTVAGKSNGKIISDNVNWSRIRCPKE